MNKKSTKYFITLSKNAETYLLNVTNGLRGCTMHKFHKISNQQVLSRFFIKNVFNILSFSQKDTYVPNLSSCSEFTLNTFSILSRGPVPLNFKQIA